MKLLLLAHVFAPYNASGSVRAVKLAEHFTARGHDVRVLTASQTAYPRTLATTIPAEKIVTTGWRRIEAPLDALRARFAARMSRDTPAPAVGAEGVVRPSLAMRGVAAYRSLVSVPDGQAGWIGPAVAAGRALVATWRPDLIYSTALPFSSHVAAARLSRRTGVPWVGEFRDLFSGNPYSDVWPLRQRVDIGIERRVVASASALVSISPTLTAYLADLHGKPAATIMNGYDPADFARAPDRSADLTPGKITIVYTGIIYPGRRDPTVLFEALRRLGDARHKFEVRFYGPSLDVVDHAARRAGVADVVRTFASVSYLESLGLQKAADALLLLLWDSPLERGVLTGKLFEYAGAGRPVLSLGCIDGAAAGLIRERRLGLATSDADEVVRFLQKLADGNASGRLGRAENPEGQTQGLTRSDQFRDLEVFLARHGLLSSLPEPKPLAAE